jgi:integrase
MFSDREIKNLKAGEKRYTKMEETSYGNGTLGIRVSPNGNKAFILRYFFRGKDKLLTLGQYPKITLAEARERSAAIAKQIDDNIDPIENIGVTECKKVKDLCALFYEKWSIPRKKSYKQDERIIKKYINPVIGHMNIHEVKRAHIKKLLEDMNKTPIMANLTLSVIRKMFNFAIEEEITEVNPAQLMREPYAKKSKTRVLNDNEINLFWNNFTNVDERPKIDKTTALALRMCLVTAQRQGEITGMKWSNIEGDFYLLEPEFSKNDLPHKIPLSFLAREIIKEAEKYKCGEYIFPSFKLGKFRGKRLNTSTLSLAINKQLRFVDVPAFTPHDLRRTAATILASMKIRIEVISALLNHKQAGITSIYVRHAFDSDKLEAVNLLAEKINGLIKC